MENKNTKNALLIFMGVLILMELVLGIITMMEDIVFVGIVNLIPIVFVSLYGFWLYKKPHGNMLKYAMLIAAMAEILIDIACLIDGFVISNSVMIVASCILVYVSGRLNRIEQNKYLLPIAFVAQFICILIEAIAYSSQFSFAYRSSWFSTPIATLTLMIAYFVRYKEHKKAGISDK